MEISKLTTNLAYICEEQFSRSGYSKDEGYFFQCHKRQALGEMLFFVAYEGDEYLGRARLLWQSLYPHFQNANIPEISDLNVLPMYRRQGIATALLTHIEWYIASKTTRVGIGVGLYPDYNDAQKPPPPAPE